MGRIINYPSIPAIKGAFPGGGKEAIQGSSVTIYLSQEDAIAAAGQTNGIAILNFDKKNSIKFKEALNKRDELYQAIQPELQDVAYSKADVIRVVNNSIRYIDAAIKTRKEDVKTDAGSTSAAAQSQQSAGRDYTLAKSTPGTPEYYAAQLMAVFTDNSEAAGAQAQAALAAINVAPNKAALVQKIKTIIKQHYADVLKG